MIEELRLQEPRTERVALEQALGRALAEEVLAPEDSPPFPKAAMDGFAVNSADPGPDWRLALTLAAGNAPARALARGECAKIMTGAMMPPGADKVIRVEYTRERDGVVTLLSEEPRQHHRRGRTWPAIACSSPGSSRRGTSGARPLGRQVRVAVRPEVGVLATGSELRNPGEPLGPGQIYNSNGLQSCAQVSAAGGRPRYYGVVRDEPSALREAVGRALEECDLLLLSGGVSMGELDFVPACWECGAEIPSASWPKPGNRPVRPPAAAGRPRLFRLPGSGVSYGVFEVLVGPCTGCRACATAPGGSYWPKPGGRGGARGVPPVRLRREVHA
jgi:molybdopterin molybdotransferase